MGPETSLFREPIAVIAIANNHVFRVWKSPKQLRHHFNNFIESLVFSTLIRCHTEKL
jgi:hypothetical protein